MALFSTRIKVLEGQVEALTVERDLSVAANLELTAANAECETRHNADQLALPALTVERDAAVASLATITVERDAARTELQTEVAGREAAIDGQVTSRLASAGVDPVKRDPKAVDKTGGAKVTGTARERLAATINAQLVS